ncbi:hypothetical protein CMT19_16675 [Elizabethkingia anophelis]|nr:hypothetical protein [Elizabethkingia anophelis]
MQKIILIPISIILLAILSCRSAEHDNMSSSNSVGISFNIKDSIFDNSINIDSQASTNLLNSTDNIQHQELVFNEDLILTADLIPQNSTAIKNALFASLDNKALVEQAPIKRAIKYRVLVYNNDGGFNTSKVYDLSSTGVSTPESGGDLKLDGGATYTFIVYSYNTNTAPNEDFSGTTVTTPFNINGNSDFMFYKKQMTLSGNGNGNNYLDVIFKHKLSQVTIIIDASPTNGYTISNLGTATIGNHYPTASVNFSTGVITPTGSLTTRNPSFATALPTAQVISNPIILNANTTAGSFSLSSITVGPITKSTTTTLNQLKIQPGIKYNLVLKLIPTDININNYNNTGYNAVRIQGQVWMRHNLGANTSLDPDIPRQAIVGSYYQWGKNSEAATASSPTTVSPWSTVTAADGSWNSGTESAPVKFNDPCPTGWRIPTQTEWNTLLSNTSHLTSDNIGSNWSTDSSNFGNAKVFRSKRNYAVKLTLPAAGNYDGSGTLTNRAAAGAYWTTTEFNSNTSYRLVVSQSDASTGAGTNNRNFGLNIRCIATQ